MANPSIKKQLMLADYHSCLDILRHEDGRKSHLFSVFLVMQGASLGAFGSVVDKSKLGGLLIAAIGMILCLLWFLVMERMKAFIELRYIQGRQLEEKLQELTTLSIELELREKGVVKVFDEEFKLRFHQRRFSISRHLESLLPVFTVLIWIVLTKVSGLW